MKYALITVPISMVLASYGQTALAGGYASGAQDCYSPCQGWSVNYRPSHGYQHGRHVKRGNPHAGYQARLRAQQQARLAAMRRAQQARLRAQQLARARAANQNCGTITKTIIRSEKRTVRRVTTTRRTRVVEQPNYVVEQQPIYAQSAQQAVYAQPAQQVVYAQPAQQSAVYANFDDGFVGFGGGSGGNVWIDIGKNNNDNGGGKWRHDRGHRGGYRGHGGGNWQSNQGWWNNRPNRPSGEHQWGGNRPIGGGEGQWSGNRPIGGGEGQWGGNRPINSPISRPIVILPISGGSNSGGGSINVPIGGGSSGGNNSITGNAPIGGGGGWSSNATIGSTI